MPGKVRVGPVEQIAPMRDTGPPNSPDSPCGPAFSGAYAQWLQADEAARAAEAQLERQRTSCNGCPVPCPAIRQALALRAEECRRYQEAMKLVWSAPL